GDGRGDVIGFAGRFHEIREIVCPCANVVLVEYALDNATKETRHPVFKNLAPRRQQRCVRRDCAAQGEQIVLVAACPVQEQHGNRPFAGLKAMDKRKPVAHQAATSSGGSTASMSLRRASRNEGNLRSCPSEETGSSTANPG